jgi:tRNA pseudouridine55 synthase
MDGLLAVDKPAGPTSHDVVVRMRSALGERRIGHTGTLDPAASGLLLLVVGRATRLAQFVAAGDKRYTAVVRLGVATDTYDGEGRPVKIAQGPSAQDVTFPTEAEIDRALDRFRGSFEQRPPAFSAKKIAGRRSYSLARASRSRVEARGTADADPVPAPDPVVVTAERIDIVGAVADLVTLDITCSPGFYVRSLAHDLGADLGIGAHLVELRRTRCGDVDVGSAFGLATLESDPAGARAAVIPLAAMLPSLGSVVLTAAGVDKAVHGRVLGRDDVETRCGRVEGDVRLLHPSGQLVGIAVARNGSDALHPSVILV